MGGSSLLVELHWEGFVPAACAAGLYMGGLALMAQLCQEYIYYYLLYNKFEGENMAGPLWVLKNSEKMSAKHFIFFEEKNYLISMSCRFFVFSIYFVIWPITRLSPTCQCFHLKEKKSQQKF